MIRPDVLIVDEDSIVVQSLSMMLASLARIRFARSSGDALVQIDSAMPELVLLDATLPDGSGLDLLRRIRALPGADTLPAVVLTARSDAAAEAAFYELGAVEFLTKPLSASQVISRVRDQLRLHRFEQIAQRAPAGYAPRPEVTILVVDDDESSIRLLHNALTPLNCRIRFAMDGESALRSMAEHVPDLVLLDVQMPGLDGIAVCRSMQRDPVLRAVPICIVTRQADEGTELRALDAGASDFVNKPYRPVTLLARVRNLLRMKEDNDSALRALSEHWQRLGDRRVADIVEASSDAIVSADTQGHVVLINSAACALLGVRADTVLGRPLSMLPDGEALQSLILMEHSSAAAPPLARTRRIRLYRGSDTATVVEPTMFLLGNGVNAITTLSLRDVTERVRAEKSTRERMAAEASNRTKSMMLSYMAHEFATPFNAIMGMTQVVLADTQHPLDATQRQRVDRVHEAARQLWSMMRDILDLSRLEAKGLTAELEPISVVEQVDKAVALVADRASEAGIRIDGPGHVPCSALADAGRLQQCLINLLTNAIKYNRRGGHVCVSVQELDGQVRIEVADDGLGMDPTQCDMLFQPFNRLGRERSGIEGTGLGLVITRLLVDAMGGFISVSSQQGVGSRFVISLRPASAWSDTA